MPEIGQTLSHYSITGKIGKGGMGEVYRAKDQILGREVAIKVLPEEFVRDSDRVARFQREAKVLASLNHPNIAAIYGMEQFEGKNFLVLELVEGGTLADRIKAGAIPVEESLKAALQIAEALEAAHEKGVIHRDLKPANIKVTPEGKVKVLDFGLAKAYAGEQAELNLSNSPTLSDAATQQGVILGTAAYMSPEQARGKTVDKRADIWAYGCVVFEMLAGRAAFSGKDVTDILAAVIRSEPEWTNLPANLHWRLREVLERCLKKDLQDRYHDISDVKADIQRVLTDPGGALGQTSVGIKPASRLRASFAWIAAAVALVAIIFGIVVWRIKPAEARRVMRFSYELPKNQQFGISENPLLAVSPDGSQFVYCAKEGLFLRSIGELDSKLIQGTNDMPTDPFFSPDGKWIGYWSVATNQLKKISVDGGVPVSLAETQKPAGPVWGKDNIVVFAQQFKGFMRVSANGGTPELFIDTKGEMAVVPKILPGGKAVLFTLVTGNGAQIALQSLQSKERKVLFPGDSAHYLPTGHIIYALGNGLRAIPFDPDRLEVMGDAVPVLEGVFRSSALFAPQYAVSNSGTLAYIPGTIRSTPVSSTIVWVDRNGKEEPLAAAGNDYRFPRISPDGKRVALNIVSAGNADIWIWDLARETMSRLTADNRADAVPIWTPDGKQIVFYSERNGRYAVYRQAADGAGSAEFLTPTSLGVLLPCSWSKDGKILAFSVFIGSGNYDIGVLSMEGDQGPKRLLQGKNLEIWPQISPDGRWMAYVSDESGREEVYVRPFSDVNKEKWQISTGGGKSPLWSPNSRELFYRSGDSVMAVPVDTEPVFKPGKPVALFSGKYVNPSSDDGRPWDISPDGKRFLMIKRPMSADEEASEHDPRKINVVVNWFEELKQGVPVK